MGSISNHDPPTSLEFEVEKCVDDKDNLHWPYVPNDVKPRVGMIFQSIEEAYSFYKSYAKIAGFGVRRGSCKYKHNEKDKVLVSKMFLCYKGGTYVDKAQIYKETSLGQHSVLHVVGETQKATCSTKGTKRRRNILREECPALMRIKLIVGEKWEVAKFVEGHSHAGLTPRKTHFLRSHRQVSSCHKSLIETFGQANIRTSQLMSVLEIESGGLQNIGCIERDIRNEIGTIRQERKLHDAQLLIEHFRDMKELNPSFYYAFEEDEEGRLKHCFWADGLSRKAYHHFGDVVVFDTTYDTNEYSLVFAPFTGINHHKETTLFGCGFISDEKKESFLWLFRKWQEAMSDENPIMIFTDQDPAITKAIKQAFPSTCHRYCMWHIMKKASVKLGLTASKPEFLPFYNCVWKSETSDQFESSWDEVIKENNLQGNEWISNLYEIRHMWIPTYSNGIFSAGLRSTQRSESINSFFDKYVSKKNSLMDFYVRFNRGVNRLRHNELASDRISLHTKPKLKTQLIIEAQMADIYTRKLFLCFQDEVMKSLNCSSRIILEDESHRVYVVKEVGKEQQGKEVIFHIVDYRAECECKLFENEGVPCWHILYVLRNEDVAKLPIHFILKRWTSRVVNEIVFDSNDIQLCMDENETPPSKKIQLLQIFYKWIDIACMEEYFDEAKKRLGDIGSWLLPNASIDASHSSQKVQQLLYKEVTIFPPKKAKTKGSGKRLIDGKEKAMLKGNRLCHGCNVRGVDHDKRNCPILKKIQ